MSWSMPESATPTTCPLPSTPAVWYIVVGSCTCTPLMRLPCSTAAAYMFFVSDGPTADTSITISWRRAASAILFTSRLLSSPSYGRVPHAFLSDTWRWREGTWVTQAWPGFPRPVARSTHRSALAAAFGHPHVRNAFIMSRSSACWRRRPR